MSNNGNIDTAAQNVDAGYTLSKFQTFHSARVGENVHELRNLTKSIDTKTSTVLNLPKAPIYSGVQHFEIIHEFFEKFLISGNIQIIFKLEK